MKVDLVHNYTKKREAVSFEWLVDEVYLTEEAAGTSGELERLRAKVNGLSELVGRLLEHCCRHKLVEVDALNYITPLSSHVIQNCEESE